MIYSGIGARDTPPETLKLMRSVGRFMASWGHTLRSGGANGADSAFEEGCDEHDGTKEIYLPREAFRGNLSPLFGSCLAARQIARQFHPYWDNLGDLGRDFMARNAYQVLGKDLKTPADFIVCWTKNGKPVGGTGQALRMAEHYHIPVVNFALHDKEGAEVLIQQLLGE
jgi:hypothetical protein